MTLSKPLGVCMTLSLKNLHLHKICSFLTLGVLSLFILLLPTGCAVLTESQVKMVNALALSSDTVAIAPSVIFEGLADIRVERGIYYASSLSSAGNQWRELNAIADFRIKEQSDIKKADQVLTILNSYLRALRSISSDMRWSAIGTELRGIGRNIDSLIIKYNSGNWGEPLPVGWGKTTSKITAEGAEWYMKRRQAKAVREFITAGDSLVSSAVKELSQIIRKGELNELIEHEYISLRENYLAYLNEVERKGELIDLDQQRHYVSLLQKMEDIKTVRNRLNTSLGALARAHNKACINVQKRKFIDQFDKELTDLNSIALELATLIKKIEK